jgi:outer membrane protein
MRNIKRLVLLMVAGLVLATGFVASASAQSMKMGYIKDDEIRKTYKAWIRAQEQWDIEKKAWDTEAQAKSDELNLMLEEYEKQRLILSDDKKREREAALRTKKDALDAYTKQIYGPEGTAERKQDELMRPLLENLNKAIEQVAIDEGYDVIFTSLSGLGYIKPTYDVTAKVLEYLDKLDQ